MIMMGADKRKMTDGIVEGIVNGKKAYSTAQAVYPESIMLCAHELLRAIESKDAEKLVSAFIALDMECDMLSGDSDSEIQL